MININIKILLCVYFLSASFCYSQKQNTIDEAIKQAIENNQQIQSAKYNVEKENALKLKAVNIPKPELFIEFEGIKGGINNFESRKIGILQAFEFPSSYFLRTDVQNSQVLVSKAELSKIVNDLKFNVKQNYYSLKLQINLLEAAKENLKVYEDLLFVAERKYMVGSTSNLEVLGAKVNKIKFENEIKNIESQIRIYQSELKKLMNVDYIILPDNSFKYVEIISAKENLLALALRNNPELSIKRFQKEKFSNKISLSKSELLPDLSFRYYKQKIGSDGDYWGFEIGIGIPFWFWWEQSGSIKEANFEYKIASSDESTIRKNIESQLNQAYEEYQNSIRQLDFFTGEALTEGNEILRQAKISYEEGSIDYVEYLMALTIAYDIKIQYLNSIYNNNKSIIELENITAGEIK
ncbi:MAG: TolC family protein [Ignavibacteria bacterium]|nr:TolC family protein [Ignavibacteria bacterium]